MRTLLFILLTSYLSGSLYAEETRYIRDTLLVPLRSGQSNQHRIVHKGLITGTAVSLLQTSEDKEYALVRTEHGVEGWLQTQYLLDTPPAGVQLKTAQAELEKLQRENKKLSAELNKINGEYRNSSDSLSTLSKQNAALSKELEEIKSISADAIRQHSENKALLLENQQLKNQADILTADNQRLVDDKENEGFLNGVFAVLMGVMITLAVPRLWPRKNSEWA